MSDTDEKRTFKLLQGYIWFPRDAQVELGDFLPERLEPDIYLLWDEVPPPFAFFDDGTLAATQRVFQFTALAKGRTEREAQGLVPWLAETLQRRLEATPPGVGWQVMEDLRSL
ncbi:DUF3208 domain-containing protein [Truepera radiovictrix]|uniref:DUF3208 domain-containing protein n=1 Tax=Truepera radiovictrix (strain DSM 17093 / CIP 108686 / LMG 22925 / RQ-24) TaxID=649638 RepID=D7CVJ9_TRURR|nr:DUF3208 domain-containing protein [Truepera radiovictrix]ADI15910.1 conserved hypothetical protein [Truepera radiovictrix DSM 17093]WMT58463.1 DUF3208 domain-containing protein [Truepera radiovictrix]